MIAGVVAVLAALAYIFFEGALGPGAPWIKTIPVLMLAGMVLRSGQQTERRLAGAGLLISAAADALIAFSFIGGLVGFLLAHLFYIAAFTRVSPALHPRRLLPVALWAVVALPFLASRAGSLAVPVVIYGVVIFTMIWRAAATVTTKSWNAGTMALAGALCFGLSDTLLGYSRFAGTLPASNVLIMGTYWTAQTLIAWSFIRQR